MTAVRAVLFDFGGVLTDSPFDGFARYERDNDLPAGLIRQINATNPDSNAWASLERNQLDRAGFAAAFEAEAAALGHRVDALAVLSCLTVGLRPAMVAALARLHGPYKTALLTNNLVGDDTPISGVHEVLAHFDVVIESSKVGLRKPEPRFYELACEQLGVAPPACVFLDDLGINLKPAAAMGMRTIKVSSADQALTELEAILDLPLR